MKIRNTMLCLTLAASAPLAFAQPKIPGTGREFVIAASQDGMTEVEMSKLALEKSSNPDVKQFANTMVQDHGEADKQLLAAAKKDGTSASPKLDPSHARAVAMLSQKSGADFDRAYATDMVNDHKNAISLFQNEATDNELPSVASFAQSTLPVLKQHEAMAQKLASSAASSANGR